MNWILFLKSWAIQSVLSRLPHWQYSKCPGTPNDNTYVLVPHRPCRRGVTCNPFTPHQTLLCTTYQLRSLQARRSYCSGQIFFFFFWSDLDIWQATDKTGWSLAAWLTSLPPSPSHLALRYGLHLSTSSEIGVQLGWQTWSLSTLFPQAQRNTRFQCSS